jgi:hypothetical protein
MLKAPISILLFQKDLILGPPCQIQGISVGSASHEQPIDVEDH